MSPTTFLSRYLVPSVVTLATLLLGTACTTAGSDLAGEVARPPGGSLRADKPPGAFMEQLDALLPAEGAAAVAFVDRGAATVAFAGSPRVTERTLFEFGSITKVVTANLLGQLVADGTLPLDARVRDYLPDAAAGDPWAGVTIRDLAVHTSGLPAHPPDWGPLRLLLAGMIRDPFAGYDRQRLTRAMRRTRLDPPGEQWRYSNYGYAVLGMVIERATGIAYAELVNRRVLEPAGMHDATLDGWSSDDVARPLTRRGWSARNWSFDAFAPAGALRGSIRDGLSFLRASMDPCARSSQVARAGCIAQESTGRPLGAGSETGIGWVRTRVDPPDGAGVTVIWHNGGTGGYSTFLGYSPETGRGVVVLTNVGRLREIDDLSRALIAQRPER